MVAAGTGRAIAQVSAPKRLSVAPQAKWPFAVFVCALLFVTAVFSTVVFDHCFRLLF